MRCGRNLFGFYDKVFDTMGNAVKEGGKVVDW